MRVVREAEAREAAAVRNMFSFLGRTSLPFRKKDGAGGGSECR